MNIYLRSAVLSSLAFVLAVLPAPSRATRPAAAQGPNVTAAAREDAYRANNVGVALLEQFKHK
ncbi:MAG: hypothetical protein ACRD68_06685, partial [Pyrinomonadaceae bacterium]